MVVTEASAITVNGAANAFSLVLDATTVSSIAGTLTTGGELTLNASQIDNVSGTISSGATLTLNDDSSLNLAGGTIAAPQGIKGTGWLGGIISGYGAIDGNVSGSVALTASSGTLFVSGSFNGNSNASIEGGAVLELGGASTSSVYFNGSTSTLQLDDPAGFAGLIDLGYVGPGVIDLTGTQVGGVSYNGVTLTVTETNGQRLFYAVNSNGGGYTPASFSDGHGGTDIKWETTPFFVSSASVSAGNGSDVEIGQAATITLATSEAAFVSGTPALTLSNGGQAVYASGAGTNTLTFTYTAQSGQKAADVTIAGLTGGTITDQAGNSLGGVAGLDLGLQVEEFSPTVAITSAGGLTTEASQTITGTVTAAEAGGGTVSGTAVTLLDNGTQVGIATVGADGAWSASVTLSEGQNILVAEDTDSADRTGASSTVTYTLDNIPPTVTITSAGGSVNHFGQTITGTVTSPAGETVVAGTTVTLYDNGAVAGTATVAADGSWSANMRLLGGANSVVAQDTDAAGNIASSPAVTYTVGAVNAAMFAGYDANGNDGLWVSDGSLAGTYELTGIAGASTAAFDAFNFTAFNSLALFEGTDASGSLGLWLSNGSAAGTTEITTVGAPNAFGKKASGGDSIAVLDGTGGQLALFNAQDLSGNYGLWVTNGTAGGTQELSGISGASTSGIDPLWLTSYGSEAVFDGVDASGNWGLWATDGTAAGTQEITGIAGTSTGVDDTGKGGPANVNGLAPHFFTAFNGEVLFTGFDASGKDALWLTDGTAAGTQELSASALDPKNFTVLNGEALFVANNASGNADLWVTNGTAAGTQKLTGITGAASSANGGLDPSNLIAFNGEVLFQGQDLSGNYGLWVSDGTAAGTHELTGMSGAAPWGLYPTNLAVVGNKVEFTGTDANGNTGLWVTKGTAATTHELPSVSGAAPTVNAWTGFVACGGEAVFSNTDASGNNGLWVTDGTAAGTQELTGIAGASASGLNPYDLTAFNGEALFIGGNANESQGLWVTNGTAAGTQELTGIYYSDPSGLTVFNGEVLFDANSTNGYGLWATNGTDAGTQELVAGVGINGGAVLNGKMLFSGNDSLWVTNGTAASTQELTGIAGAATTGLSSFSPQDLTAFNGEALFEGADSSGNNGLWVTDGTTGGTHELSGIAGVSTGLNADGYTNGLDPTGLTVLNNNLAVFAGYDFSGNSGLWVTDGTVNGTYELTGTAGASTGASPYNSIPGLNPSGFVAYNGKALFTGWDSSGNPGLWVTDGTVGGTQEIANGLYPSGLSVFDGKVLFSANNALWFSDGTAAGTQEIPGTAGLQPSSLTSVTFNAALDAPTVEITSAGGITNDASQTITGTGSVIGGTVTLYDNGAQIGTATVASDGSWSASVTLSGDGAHSLVAKDTDAPAIPERARR